MICVLPNCCFILSGFYTACVAFAPGADEETTAPFQGTVSTFAKLSARLFPPLTLHHPPNSPLDCASNSIGMATSSAVKVRLQLS